MRRTMLLPHNSLTRSLSIGTPSYCSAHAGYSQLIVNGRIVVRKDQESGQINVEGPLCEDFFRVRHVVCGQYVQI